VTTLTEFLRARIDEDEAAARQASQAIGSGEWAHGEGQVRSVRALVAETVVDRHIARHDPARVLREVTAKRAMIEEFELPGLDCVSTGEPDNCRQHRVMKMLAAPYSDHPEFRKEWAV
jgi:hypothetical protein